MSRLCLNEVRSETLFVSTLQPSDQPTAAQIQEAITQSVRRYGCRGCAARMAQEFGDAPDAAVIRMRWARRAIYEVYPTIPHTRATGTNAVRCDGDRRITAVSSDLSPTSGRTRPVPLLLLYDAAASWPRLRLM